MTVFDDMLGDANGIYQDSDFALSGRFYPGDGSPPSDIRLMRREPESFGDGGAGRVAVSGLVFSVMQSEVPNKPKEGDALSQIATADGAETIYDVEAATADGQRLEWFISVTRRKDP